MGRLEKTGGTGAFVSLDGSCGVLGPDFWQFGQVYGIVLPCQFPSENSPAPVLVGAGACGVPLRRTPFFASSAASHDFNILPAQPAALTGTVTL
jgi:hypothetical protein